MPNPFFTLQARLKTLIAAHAYFTGATVLTEEVGDIENKVMQELIPLGFGVVISTAKGEMTPSLDTLSSRETLIVEVISNPTLKPDKNALDGLWAAITAINGKAVVAPVALAPSTADEISDEPIFDEQDVWRCIRHERRTDVMDGLHVQMLTVAGHAVLEA